MRKENLHGIRFGEPRVQQADDRGEEGVRERRQKKKENYVKFLSYMATAGSW